MRRCIAILFLALGMVPPPGAAEAARAAPPGRETVRVQGIGVRADDLIMTLKGTTLYLLWDAFPYNADLPNPLSVGALGRMAEDLVSGFALKKHPKVRRFRVTILEFTDRDSYGAPRYDLTKTLGRFEISLDAKTGLPLTPLNLDAGGTQN